MRNLGGRALAWRTMVLASVSTAGLTGHMASAQVVSPSTPAATTPDRARDAGDVIIVTARTFEEDLQDVPLSVSVLTDEALERQGIEGLADIAEKTVGFSFEDFTGPLAQPTIRGQTNLRVTSPVTNVATYLDGIYLQRPYLIDQGLIDLQRVEIIKGPQSALYGRNAFAGVINLISKAPDLNRIGGHARAGIGTDEFYELSGTLNIPLFPGELAILGHVAYQEFDGTWQNDHPLADTDGCITCGNLGGFEKETYQVTLLGRPSDAISLRASYFHTERLVEHVPNYSFGTAGLTDAYNYNNCSPVASPPSAFNPNPQAENRLYCGELVADPNYATGAQSGPLAGPVPDPRPEGILIDPRGFGLRGPTDVVAITLDVEPTDALKLTYQFGYTFGNIDARGSTQRNPLGGLVLFGQNFGTLFDASGTGSEFESTSHDARITYESEAIYAFIGGNFAQTSDIESNASEVYPVGTTATPGIENILFPVGPGLPFPTAFFQRRTFIDREEDIYSVYGFVEVRPTEALRVSLEGRYTSEDRTATDFLTREPTNPAIQAFDPPVAQITEDFFAPRGSITFEITPDNQVYASAARGVKAGGFNGFVPFEPQRQYTKETNWTYELGSKNFFPGLGLTLNGAVYYTDWQDLQTTEVRRNADGLVPATFAVLSTVTGNVGSVEVYGAELQGVWELTDNFTLDFGAAYNRSRYKDGEISQRFQLAGNCDGVVCPTGEVPIGGNQVERIPEFDGFVGLGYEQLIGPDALFYLRGDASYQTKQYVDEVNLAWVPDRFLVNLQAGVDFGGFNVRATVQNLLDKEYVSNSLFLIGTGGARSSSYVPIFGPQRTARLSVGVEF